MLGGNADRAPVVVEMIQEEYILLFHAEGGLGLDAS